MKPHFSTLAPVLALLITCAGISSASAQSRTETSSNVDISFVLERLASVPLAGEPEVDSPDSRQFQDAQALYGKPVGELVLAGPAMGFDPVSEIDLTVGDLVSAHSIRFAVLSLWHTGNYRDIQLSGKLLPDNTVQVIIAAAPMLRQRELKISGNNALDTDQIERILNFVPDRTILPEQRVLLDLRNKLTDAYFEIGYQSTTATIRLEATGEPGDVALVVEIQEGSPELYTRVEFEGIPLELPSTYVGRKTGLKKNTPKDKQKVDKGIDKLIELLAQFGYRDAKEKQYIEAALAPHEWKLIVPVTAGPKTTIRFEGNEHFVSRDLETVLTDDANIFRTSPDSVEYGLKRLSNHYRRAGYFHIRLQPFRHCLLDDERTQTVGIDRNCPPDVGSQELVIRIQEGPLVEISQINFVGNRYFSDEEIKEELFAFVREQTKEAGAFGPINTKSADDLGISDKRPAPLGKNRGIPVPSFKPERTYLPELYAQAVEHLTNIYMEQGFLSVEVDDRCDLTMLPPLSFMGKSYAPLAIERSDVETKKHSTLYPCVHISDDLDQLILRIHIREGIQTRFKDIEFQGNEVLSSAELQEAAQIFPGDPYNELRIRKAPRTLRLLYQSHGYMFATIDWHRSFSPDERDARIVFSVSEGPPVRVGRIVIEGAGTTSKNLIRERLTFESGDLLTPRVIENSQQSLMELGIFTGAMIQMIEAEEIAATKDVKIVVSEGKPQYMELQAGIATIEGLRGGFEYGYRNLAGWALTARLRLRANYRLFFVGNSSFEERYHELSLSEQIERHILASIGQPHFPKTRGLLGWSVDVVNERVNEPSFSVDRNTAYINLTNAISPSRQFRRGILIEARTGLEDTTLDLPKGVNQTGGSPQFQSYLNLPEGDSTFWVTGLALVLNLRDHPFMPSKGFYMSAGAELVRSIANYESQRLKDENGEFVREDGKYVYVSRISNLIRLRTTLSGYIPLIGQRTVLALSTTAGYIFHLQDNSTTWADRYFYMGGTDTLRGFPDESLVPEDIYQTSKNDPAFIATLEEGGTSVEDYRGGQAMLLVRAEARHKITETFVGAVFGEAGNIWRDLAQINPFALRPVLGGGFRYLTPVGPLSFDMGFNLIRRPHEELLAWFISIGSAF